MLVVDLPAGVAAALLTEDDFEFYVSTATTGRTQASWSPPQ
jgi:hypothetical protein